MSKIAILHKILLSFYCLMMCTTVKAFSGSECNRECFLSSNHQDANQRWFDKSAGCKAPLRGPPGPPGTTQVCSTCISGCLVADLVPLFGYPSPPFPVNMAISPPGTPETFGPVTLTAWNISPFGPLTLYNKDTGLGEQGIGIFESGMNHEINLTNFVQIDISSLLALAIPPNQIVLTIQSVQTGEGYAIYQSSMPGVLGTFILSGNNPATGSVIQTVSVPITATTPSFINVTGTTGDVLLSSIAVPQCESINAPFMLVAPLPLTTATVDGSYVGQLGFFQVGSTYVLHTWAGLPSRWVP